ncbi:MAG: XTP/dITP diphosphatase [Desulfobacteraceae bacterium]|nr:MAG: XTP/dITP diphosphatase [Desulfobacteraceae bacterium]
MPDQPLVLATRNKGKLKEFQELFADFPIALKSLADFEEIPEVREDGRTFAENAAKKARFTARILGVPALADDSGLVVDALAGDPGVHSARYAGGQATDAANIQKLLQVMETVSIRKAAFECVLTVAEPGGTVLYYTGRCEGEITYRPMGRNGFGYDPVFYCAPFKKTFAQLSAGEKNQISHRAKALQALRAEFGQVLAWLEKHKENR